MEYKSQEYVQQLHWKLDTLKTEIQKSQAEIEERNAIVGEKQQQVEHVLKLLEAEGVKIDRTDLDGIIPVSLSEVVAKILRDRGEAMHYKKIAEAVQETGRKIAGQNPPATIIALLHRKKDEFVRLDEGVWGLKEWGKTPQAKKAKRKKVRRVRKKS
jgi:hypothetical protein